MKKNTSNKSLLFNKPSCKNSHDNLQLLRIINSNEFCKVDFGYVATDYYVRGGWVRLSNETFLRDTKTQQKFKFIKAINITIEPEQYHFKTNKDWLYFSVYFEPLPENISTIDFIELEEPQDSTFFNFYGIYLDINSAIELL